MFALIYIIHLHDLLFNFVMMIGSVPYIHNYVVYTGLHLCYSVCSASTYKTHGS